jgi:hypothetical protein
LDLNQVIIDVIFGLDDNPDGLTKEEILKTINGSG